VTSTAHVAEGSLAGTVGTTSTDTWDTCDGTSSTPGFSTGLVTCFLADRKRLSAVLGDLMVDEADDVRPDGCLEDRGKTDGRLGVVALFVVDGNQGTSR